MTTTTATAAFAVNDTVRYIAEAILDPSTRKNWTVLDVNKDGVVTLAPAPGNDTDEASRTVYRDQLERLAIALKPTPARLRLLADVQRHRVYQHPDGASLNAGASGRQVTTRIAHLEGAGWVRLVEGSDSDYDIRYWELTDAGRQMLALAQP